MSDGCPYKHASEIDFMDPIVQENWFEAYNLIREESPAYFHGADRYVCADPVR
jgi:hypothetical protein